MKVLTDEVVNLRPIERSDLAYLNRWKNNKDIYRYLGGGFLPVSIAVQEQWMNTLMDTTGSSKRFLIESAEEKPLGMIGLYNINWIHRNCELGIFIGEKEEQNKGYARRAYMLMEQYALRYLNLRKIKAEVVKSNTPAVKMYEKLNFIQVGCLKEERFIDGEYHDLLIMERIINTGTM